MNQSIDPGKRLQSVTTEQFFYFFLRMRKSEIRRIVGILQKRHPDEGPAQLARRLVSSSSAISLLGGSLLTIPLLLPGVGQALKLFGVVGATSMLTRMHLYLIMQIAMLFGKDLDDPARVRELALVIAASGLVAASPMLAAELDLDPRFGVPIGALTAAATTQLIGHTAIALYGRGAASMDALEEALASGPAIAA